MASSSQSHPSSDPCWKYDVFLSFRGPDTRKGITDQIHKRLTSGGIKTFLDDRDIEVGDFITSTLVEAIRKSRFAIVVLSQNYASSTWCLDELSEICLSMQDKRIKPLFYQVKPHDVRYQKQSFEKAFTHHEESGRHESDKLKQWKFELKRVADTSGWNTDDFKTHEDLIDAIVEYFRSKIVPEAIESSEDFQVFEATRKAMDEILKALKDNEVTAVGVYGMGGVGKTTLVKHVGAQTRKSGIFDIVTTVAVSQHPNYKKLQDTMADLLGFKINEKTEIGRASRLHKEIMGRTKILIILDDIWGRIELSTFGIPSYKELQKCESKVLFTTRIFGHPAMDCQRQIHLNVLSEDDSWDLFERKAGRSLKLSTFEGVAKKVVTECKGLPVALVAVSRALGYKYDLEEWTRAAERLKKSQLANPDDNGDVVSCIKLSYDYLKDQSYKSYFLLCCLFPEGYDIPIEELFRYAIGEGLFRDDETLNEARNNAGSVVTHLKHSYLLLESAYGRRFVRMHDVVRDAAIQIARFEDGHGFLVRADCGLVDWPRQLQGYSAVSLMRNAISKLPEMLKWPKLQILLLNNNPFTEETTKTFFQRRSPNKLRVLDLSWTKFSLLSLGLLTNLQALYLDGCDINDTSILGKLRKLEILSMRNSHVTELSIEIGELTNLRMLDNTGGVVYRIPSKVISKLHNLEEMYMQGFVEWRSIVEVKGEETNAAGLDEVTGLSKLRIFKVRFSSAKCIPKYVEFIPNWVEFDIIIGQYDLWEMQRAVNFSGSRNSMCLKTDTISGLPDWFCNKVLNAAESLCWKESGRLIDIFVESELGRLTGLKQLLVEGPESVYRLRKLRKLTNTMSWVPKKPVFENLEVLQLLNVNCKELFAVKSLPLGSLFNLKVLRIRGHCDVETIRLPSTLLERLVNLEELALRGYSMEGSELALFGYEEALLVSKLSKLRNIQLSDKVAVSICDGPAPAAMFQNLQSLTIHWWDSLEGSLFSYDVAQCLTQLNCLVVEYCPFLERIVESSNDKIILPKLKHLSLTELSGLCYESATFDIECPSLEYLELSGCPKFSASLSDFHSKKQIQLGRWRPY